MYRCKWNSHMKAVGVYRNEELVAYYAGGWAPIDTTPEDIRLEADGIWKEMRNSDPKKRDWQPQGYCLGFSRA